MMRSLIFPRITRNSLWNSYKRHVRPHSFCIWKKLAASVLLSAKSTWKLITDSDNFFKLYHECFFCIFEEKIIFLITSFPRGSEFSSYEIELRKQVTQNDVTLWVTNSKLKNKNLHFELLTRSRKINSYTSSY